MSYCFDGQAVCDLSHEKPKQIVCSVTHIHVIVDTKL